MRCSKAIQQLQLYLDQQLSLDEVRALEAHLAECTTCQGELFLLEEVVHALYTITPVTEPTDLTASIMRRVAANPRHKEESAYRLLRISLLESLIVISLATITTLGIILGQPPLRESLPFANGHDFLSIAFVGLYHALFTLSGNTTVLLLWIVGTILGICITWMAAGSEMRATWYKAMIDRLPVW
jgi:predicted anti-sigma-YlaC factor YlaD